MIPTSRRAMGLCVAIAIVLEAGVVFAFAKQPDQIAIEGSGGGADIRLGNSFADFAVGSIPSVATTRSAPAAVVAPAIAAMPVTAAVLPVVEAAVPTAALSPVQSPPPSELAPESAPRPQERPVVRDHAPKATQDRPASAAGNSARAASRGQSTGRATGQDAAQGQGAVQTAAGNAAVSNYPGQVMRHLSRISRPRVGSRGTASVSFALAQDGGVSRAVIATSSGSDELDRAALQLIARAAPFPVPPAGATREFTVQIQGR